MFGRRPRSCRPPLELNGSQWLRGAGGWILPSLPHRPHGGQPQTALPMFAHSGIRVGTPGGCMNAGQKAVLNSLPALRRQRGETFQPLHRRPASRRRVRVRGWNCGAARADVRWSQCTSGRCGARRGWARRRRGRSPGSCAVAGTDAARPNCCGRSARGIAARESSRRQARARTRRAGR